MPTLPVADEPTYVTNGCVAVIILPVILPVVVIFAVPKIIFLFPSITVVSLTRNVPLFVTEILPFTESL